MMKLSAIVGIVLIAVSSAGCGYSLAGRGSFLPDYVRNIGVPQFTNNTSVIDIDRMVSERVRIELSGRGRYKVFPTQAGMDAVLSGVITAVTTTPVAFNQQQQASRYVLTISARIEFNDIKSNKVLWSNPAMQFREEFEPATSGAITDASVFFDQDKNALERIAGEFARSVVSALLEAF